MADIELVIKIPEDSYKATCNGCMLPPDVENVVQGIKHGTPLPRWHGDLIDRDYLAVTPIDATDLPTDKCLMVYCAEEVDDAPVILPAEKRVIVND